MKKITLKDRNDLAEKLEVEIQMLMDKYSMERIQVLEILNSPKAKKLLKSRHNQEIKYPNAEPMTYTTGYSIDEKPEYKRKS